MIYIMEEFDLDFSDIYGTSINSLKETKKENDNNFPCESIKCKKFNIKNNTDDNIKDNTRYNIKDNTEYNIKDTTRYNIKGDTVSPVKNITHFKNIKKNKNTNSYNFYLVLFLFLYCNNYSLVLYLTRFKINYYTSLLIRLILFAILYHFGQIYISNQG